MLRTGLLLLLLGCFRASGQPLDAIENLFNWIRELGGEVNVEVKINSNGVRGIFATKAIAENETISAIPAAAIMNTGGYNESFAVPTLTVLRELKSTCSRFKPYVDMWPKPHEVVNSCNMDVKYAPMWKSTYWEKSLPDWEYHLQNLLEGKLDADLEYTIKEMVGNVTVTLDDLKYACAISSTRYVSSNRRRRLLMAPVFDLANHKRVCSHYLSQYETGDFLYFIAGEPLQKGDEVCYSYGSLRDDYALAHYGFLPDLEDPPRLALVDTPGFNPDVPYSHDDPPGEEPFEGDREEMLAEMQRLMKIYRRILNLPDAPETKPKGADYMYDMLKELEQRRLDALRYEITRIAGILNIKTEL